MLKVIIASYCVDHCTFFLRLGFLAAITAWYSLILLQPAGQKSTKALSLVEEKREKNH
jgi:hypothetical protein